MGIWQNLKNAFTPAADVVPTINNNARQEISSSVLSLNPQLSNYENLFAQVRPLVDEMKVVMPYGVSANGAQLPLSRTPELELLMMPNDEMGWSDFMDTMLSTWITEDELLVHVWRKGARGRVSGYTFVPPESRIRIGNDYYYQFMDGDKLVKLSQDEVMALRYSRNPRNVMKGVSPVSSVSLWAQIDDLVAQYQRAFFENGAVPATITFITASTHDKYEEKRKALEMGLKGARNRNKTIYAWRQMLDDGTTGDEVEVKTIQPANSTLAIKDLNYVITDRLNKAIGVSNFILGDDSSAKYDNAELSDRQFTKRRVYPALVSFWSQFQHELDRITGGLGYAIQFDLEIPELTDRQKAQAEIKRIESETTRITRETAATDSATLVSLIQAGAEPVSAVKALGLGKQWLDVANSLTSDSVQNEGVENESEETVDRLKVVQAVFEANRPKFGEDEKEVERIYNLLMMVAEEYAKENPVNLDEISNEILNTLRALAEQGALEGAEHMAELEFDRPAVHEAIEEIVKRGVSDLGQEFYDNLELRVRDIVDNYNLFARDAIREVLATSRRENWSARQIQVALETAMPRARAEMIARTETHHAVNSGRMAMDDEIAKDYGLKILVEWNAHIDSRTCAYCREMDGTKVPLGEAFPDHVHVEEVDPETGEVVTKQVTVDPSIYNNFGKTPDAHPNCRCTFNEIVEFAE